MRYFDHHSNYNARLYHHSRRVPTADNLEDCFTTDWAMMWPLYLRALVSRGFLGLVSLTVFLLPFIGCFWLNLNLSCFSQRVAVNCVLHSDLMNV